MLLDHPSASTHNRGARSLFPAFPGCHPLMPVSLVEKEPAPSPFPTKSAFLPAFSCAFAGAAENGGQPNCCRAVLGSPSVVDPGHTHRGFLGFGEGRASRGAQWHTEKLGMARATGRSGFCQGVSQEGKCDIIQGLCHIICLFTAH